MSMGDLRYPVAKPRVSKFVHDDVDECTITREEG